MELERIKYMAKQKYERKESITICGMLDVDDDGQYVVTVEDKDNSTEYELKSILDSMVGSVVTFSSESYL